MDLKQFEFQIMQYTLSTQTMSCSALKTLNVSTYSYFSRVFSDSVARNMLIYTHLLTSLFASFIKLTILEVSVGLLMAPLGVNKGASPFNN